MCLKETQDGTEADVTLLLAHLQWHRQLWGTGACAPSTSNNFILLHLNLTGNYPSTCSLPAEWLAQMSTTRSSFDQHYISHKTISHQAAAAPGPEARCKCSMT